MLCTCCSSASSLEIQTGFFFKSVTLWTALQIPLWSKPHWYPAIKFTKLHSAKCLLHKINGHDWGAASKSAHLNCPNLTHFHLTEGWLCGNSCMVMLWLLVSCYSLLQYSRLAWLALFVDHMHIHSMNNLRWQPHWFPRLMSLLRKSRDWWRTQDSSLGQPTKNKID